jgi:hypothetical protein
VITGFNTDIDFEGVTYHVQTEDKGLDRPMILSLVYDRGTILASKRSPYDDLVSSGFDEKVLAERLQRQHKLICAALKAGRIEDLKKMSSRDTPASSGSLKSGSLKSVKITSGVTVTEPAIAKPFASGAFGDAPIPMPDFDLSLERALPGEPIVDVIGVIDEDNVLPAEAVEVVSDMAGTDRPANNKLSIEFIGDQRFKGGETKTVSFMVLRGSGRKVVAGAEVMVKIIGSNFRPLIFHSSTDENGLARVTMQLPSFRSGRAAFLVRAISDGEEIEMRRAISHG